MRIGDKLNIRSTILIVLLGISLLSASSQVFAQVERVEQMRLLTAFGTAEVNIRPDLAIIRLGVETEATTAVEARQLNAERVNRIIQELRRLGIPEQSIETSMFQINPVRRFDNNTNQGVPPIVGYQVLNIVSVRTENMELISRIIDESVRAGANRVEDVTFTLRNQTSASQNALRQAVANARQNAEQMAKELGVKLVRVQSVQQGGGVISPPPVFFRGGVAMEATAPTPIFPGQVTVNSSVTLTYVIE